MKKALILAGGKGTRLLPLTLFTPKPLMPFFDKTLCERILLQLKEAGFSDIVISTGYQKEKIVDLLGQSYNGLNIRYIKEDKPLGTAGALYYIKDFWDFEEKESFAVISGDCLFDFNICDAINTHKKTNADITIVSTKAKEPTEYGIINADNSGKIYGFNEKPSWSQVTGCNINTGIYFLKACITKLIPEKAYDFSNDLFPFMLNKKMHLQQHKANGFWSDIGTPESYYHALKDALDGKIKNLLKPQTEKIRKLEKNGVKITLPVFISDKALIEKGCDIGPYSVISEGVNIKKGARISNSVIQNNCVIGEDSHIDGAIICKGVSVGNYSLINNNSILKEGYILSEHGVFSGNKEIFNEYNNKPEKRDFFKFKATLFCNDAIFVSEISKKTKSLDNCEKICSALISASNENAKFGIMSDKSHHSAQFAQYLTFSAENLGARLYSFGEGFEKLAGFVAASLHFDCFIYVFEKDSKIFCRFFNKYSLPPSREFERKFEFFYYNNKSPEQVKYQQSKKMDNCEAFYKNEVQDCLLSYCAEGKLCGFTVSFINPKENRYEFSILRQTFTELCGKISGLKEAYEKNHLIVKYSSEHGIIFEQENICANRYALIAAILKEEKERGATEFLLPVSFPRQYARIFDGNEKIYSYPFHSARRLNIPPRLAGTYHWILDDILLGAKAISIISQKGSLAKLLCEEAEFFYCENTVFLPESFSKADIMEKLRSGNNKNTTDCFEGTLIEYPEGKVTVVPQSDSCIKIFTEARNEESAKQLFKQTESFILS